MMNTTGIKDCLINIYGEKIVEELFSHKDETRGCLEKTYGIKITDAILSEDNASPTDNEQHADDFLESDISPHDIEDEDEDEDVDQEINTDYVNHEVWCLNRM